MNLTEQADNSANTAILPPEAFQRFKTGVEQGASPATVLRQLMQTWPAQLFDPGAVIHMLRVAYPDGDIQHGGFRFRINDSNYPHSDPDQFSDQDFDQAVARMLASPW